MKTTHIWARALALLAACCGAAALVPCAAQTYLPAGTKSGFVTTLDGARIHYLEAGPAATARRGPTRAGAGRGGGARKRPSILFVPGWMAPGWIWERQLAHFARDYRVVAIDPRSQGESSKPTEGHHPAARARDIKRVVDRLALAPVVLVASTIAVSEAASYVAQFGTDTLAGLVLVNGIAGRDYDAETLQGLLAYADSFQTDRRAGAERFVRGWYKKPPGEPYVRRMIRATLRMPTNSALAVFLGSLTADHRPALARIDRPTLIVVARTPAWMSFYEDLQRRIRGSRMEVFDGAGHALFVEEAARFNSLLDSFLREEVLNRANEPR